MDPERVIPLSAKVCFEYIINRLHKHVCMYKKSEEKRIRTKALLFYAPPALTLEIYNEFPVYNVKGSFPVFTNIYKIRLLYI